MSSPSKHVANDMAGHAPAPQRPDVDLPREQRRILAQSALALIVCLAVLASAVFVLPPLLELPSAPTARGPLLAGANLLIGLWVVFGIRQVASLRFRSAQDNAGSAYGPPSPALAVRAAFLQNTLEQAFVAVVAFNALATQPGEAVSAYLLAAAILFGVGRLAFLRGYPGGAGARAFGVAVTALPTLGAVVWAATMLSLRAAGLLE